MVQQQAAAAGCSRVQQQEGAAAGGCSRARGSLLSCPASPTGRLPLSTPNDKSIIGPEAARQNRHVSYLAS